MIVHIKHILYRLVFSVLLIVGFQACATEGPRPIKYGKDQCSHCRMTISDSRFATQLVTKKGRAYNFDDLSCMVEFVKDGSIAKEDIAHFYLPDYGQDKKLFIAENMFLIKSEGLKSPMRGDIAAFEKESDMQAVKAKFGGNILTWDDLWK